MGKKIKVAGRRQSKVEKIQKLNIDWHGNVGRCCPAPGTVEMAKCGICGIEMNVERNVLGPTSWAESMAGRKHRHDSFRCPNLGKDWHRRIYRLKTDVYLEEIDSNDSIGYEQKKKVAEKEILKLLETNL